EYTFTDDYYRERENFLAGVASDGAYVSDQDSYLEDVDFNSLFEEKRAEINKKVDEQLEIFRKASLDAGLTLPDDTLKLFKRDLIEQESRKAAGEIDQDLVEKRPHLARKKMREILTAKIKEEASNLLIINGLDEKGQELQPIFSPHLRNLQTTDANDAIIVKFILGKLYRQFGPVKDRDNQTLQNSINSIPEILAEVSRMLK
ncbi:TPA: helicase, partial [Escherichia coli]|nr:helicase [Escherichia coli]